MSSTPTAILGLELQARGDNTGVWDFNANRFIQDVEDTVAGVVSVSTTGGTTTLSLNAYASDTSRMPIVRIGVGQTLTSNVFVVTQRFREYLVTNETVGGSNSVNFGVDAVSHFVAIPRGCAARILAVDATHVYMVGLPINITTALADPSGFAFTFPISPTEMGIRILNSLLSTPPGSPATGDTYVVAPGGTGAWSTHDNNIAVWNGSAWTFTAAAAGMIAWDQANGYFVAFDTSWHAAASIPYSANKPLPRGSLGGFIAGLGTIASASTTDLSTVSDIALTITGTTTINQFGPQSAQNAGLLRIVEFTGSLALVNGTWLVTHTGANVQTTAGDWALIQFDATGHAIIAGYFKGPNAAPSLPTTQRFSAGSGTYFPSTGAIKARVRMCGGGGGGAAQSGNAGSNGGDTSFGAWTALHGVGGFLTGNIGGYGGTGGVNGTGNLIWRFAGGQGSAAGSGSGTNGGLAGGSGGNNPFGGGGSGGGGGANLAGQAGAANTGAGGGGAGNFGSSPAAAGSGGGAGEYVEFWISLIGIGSIGFTVGGGGAGGAAGGQAGGAGAGGILIVEEYYT